MWNMSLGLSVRLRGARVLIWLLSATYSESFLGEEVVHCIEFGYYQFKIIKSINCATVSS